MDNGKSRRMCAVRYPLSRAKYGGDAAELVGAGERAGRSGTAEEALSKALTSREMPVFVASVRQTNLRQEVRGNRLSPIPCCSIQPFQESVSVMESHLSPLFSPLELKNLKMRNRIVMAPITRSRCPGGIPQEKIADYYARRSAGGVGLIITEGVVIDHPASLGDSGVDGLDIPNMYNPAALGGWRRVVEKVHVHGAKIFPQLWHQGGMRRNGTGPFPWPCRCALPEYGDPWIARFTLLPSSGMRRWNPPRRPRTRRLPT